MIHESNQRAFLVSAAPPDKLQFYSGQVDGACCFSCDWRMGVPFTHNEAKQVVVELEHAFIKHSKKYEVVWLGDVA